MKKLGNCPGSRALHYIGEKLFVFINFMTENFIDPPSFLELIAPGPHIFNYSLAMFLHSIFLFRLFVNR